MSQDTSHTYIKAILEDWLDGSGKVVEGVSLESVTSDIGTPTLILGTLSGYPTMYDNGGVQMIAVGHKVSFRYKELSRGDAQEAIANTIDGIERKIQLYIKTLRGVTISSVFYELPYLQVDYDTETSQEETGFDNAGVINISILTSWR